MNLKLVIGDFTQIIHKFSKKRLIVPIAIKDKICTIDIISTVTYRGIPRPFDNMRMSRSNEVYGEYGVKEESLWIGHSTKTLKDHYGVTTDDDFKKAVARKFIKPVDIPDAEVITEIVYDNQS